MFEKIFGKKKSIQRRLIWEFSITIILVTIFSVLGFYIFVHQEAEEIIQINVQGDEEIKSLLGVIRRGIFVTLASTIIISTVMIRLATKKMMVPLEQLIDSTKKVASGDFTVRLETDRKDEVEDLVTNFNYMVRELSKTELLQKDFIDNISHEIKTPINSIQGFTKLLDDDNITKEERKEYVRNNY